MQDFRNLIVWHKAHALTCAVYAFAATLRHPSHYCLRDQIARAALSVPANLAEGCGRTGNRELRKFVRVALGSASELEYHLLLARDLGLLHPRAFERLTAQTVEVKRMLSGLAARLTAQLETGS